MNILGKRSDLPFSCKSDHKKEKSMVSFTHVQNIGRFQKISIPIPRTAFRISEGEGGSWLWNSEGMEGYLRLEIRRHGGIPQVGFLE